MSTELDISINSDFSGCSNDVSYVTVYSCRPHLSRALKLTFRQYPAIHTIQSQVT